MLKDNLYTVSSIEKRSDDSYAVGIALDASHNIFKGHFPGQPVLPGVCLIEMVKEILTTIKEKPYKLENANQIKYVQLVDPNASPTLNMSLQIKEEAGSLHVNVNSCLENGASHFKLKGIFS